MNMFHFFFSLMGKKTDVLERLYKLDKAVKKRKTNKIGDQMKECTGGE